MAEYLQIKIFFFFKLIIFLEVFCHLFFFNSKNSLLAPTATFLKIALFAPVTSTFILSDLQLFPCFFFPSNSLSIWPLMFSPHCILKYLVNVKLTRRQLLAAIGEI